MRFLSIIFMVLVVVFITGCGNKTPIGVSEKVEPESNAEIINEGITDNVPASNKNLIEITSSGFSPSSLTINKGESVTFVNKDSSRHWPASAVHPTHTVYPGSDIKKCGSLEKIFDACKGLEQEETFTFVFNEVGEWGYHDHLKSDLRGKIIVK